MMIDDNALPDTTKKEWNVPRVIQATLVVVAIGIAFIILFRFRLVIFSLFEAIVFSTAISPLVNFLEKRKISRPVSVSLVYLAFVAGIVGFFYLFLPLIGEQGTTIVKTLSGYYQQLRSDMISSPSILLAQIGLRIPSDPLAPGSSGNAATAGPQLLFFANEAARGIFTLVSVLLLTLYWTVDRERTILSLLILAPLEKREAVRDFYYANEEKVGAYMRGLFFLCATVGAMALIAYLIIGLPYALFLGITAGILEAVPLVGPILGAAPALLIALALDPSKAVWVVLATEVIQLTENHFLVPRVMNKAVGVNPVVSLLAFAAFSSLFGLAGALLAIPLAVLIQLFLNRTVLEPTSLSQPQPAGRDAISLMRYEAQELIQDVRKQVREKDGVIDSSSDQIEDAIEEVVNDLDSILARVENYQEGNNP